MLIYPPNVLSASQSDGAPNVAPSAITRVGAPNETPGKAGAAQVPEAHRLLKSISVSPGLAARNAPSFIVKVAALTGCAAAILATLNAARAQRPQKFIASP